LKALNSVFYHLCSPDYQRQKQIVAKELKGKSPFWYQIKKGITRLGEKQKKILKALKISKITF